MSRWSRNSRKDARPASTALSAGMASGYLKVLSDHEVERIHRAALEVLETIGIGDATPSCISACTSAGAVYRDGRLFFPASLVEDTIKKASRNFPLFGQNPANDIEPWGKKVYFGTAGAAISIVDPATKTYRDSTLRDLYDLARVVDRMEHISFYQRPVVARDIADVREFDINTCYASISGTAKHVGSAWVHPENVAESLAMLHMVAGEEKAWRARPFVSMTCTFVVPPLKFAEDSCDCLEVAVRGGMPVLLLSGPMVGATAPITLAGGLAQSTAEILAGLVFVNALVPGHPAIFGCWGGMCDVRSGAMVIGCGEQALFAAASAQMADYYDLTGGTMAGASDAKLPDNQAGAEKAISLTTAASAGANLVYESAGMLASLLGMSYEALVLDNDMIGMARRVVRGIEVNDESLAVQAMRDVVASGEGHYLGHPMTLNGMTSQFVFPAVFDRKSPQDWHDAGASDVVATAAKVSDTILAEHFPSHIDEKTDAAIREAFPICLPREVMRLQSQNANEDCQDMSL
jgi:trimethylamine--corrinoid protein Co-methyltransferase